MFVYIRTLGRDKYKAFSRSVRNYIANCVSCLDSDSNHCGDYTYPNKSVKETYPPSGKYGHNAYVLNKAVPYMKGIDHNVTIKRHKAAKKTRRDSKFNVEDFR